MNNLLDDMIKLKNDIYNCLDDLKETTEPIYNDKIIFQDTIIKGLFIHFKELTTTIDNLNETIVVLSKSLVNEINENKLKTEKIELLQFKVIESRVKIKELNKKIKYINNVLV